MSNITLENLVSYSETIFNKPDSNSLSSLENLVRQLAGQTDAFELCLLLLQYPQTHTQKLACEVMSHLLTAHLTPINTPQKVYLQNFILTRITTNNDFDPYVTLKLIQVINFMPEFYLVTYPPLLTSLPTSSSIYLLIYFLIYLTTQIHSMVTKIGWFENYGDQLIFQNLIQNLNPLLNSGKTQHLVTGVRVLRATVCTMKMNSVVMRRQAGVVDRSTCHSFRDSALLPILLFSIHLIRLYHAAFNEERDLGESVLGLHGEVMGFTFIEGGDESCDESVQLPNSFKAAMLDEKPLKLLVQVYEACGAGVCGGRLIPQIISCIAQHSCIRRSFFNNEERAFHLADVINAIIIIITSEKASDSDSTHQLCCLLARLKVNFQLGEMMRVEGYESLISLLTHFTTSHFEHRDLGSTNEHHLLSFWDKMLAPLPYIDLPLHHHLHPFPIFQAYVLPRIRNTSDDPLEDLEEVSQHLELLCSIGRHNNTRCLSLLIDLMPHNLNVCWMLLISSHMTNHVTPEVQQQHAMLFCRAITQTQEDKEEECCLIYLRHFCSAFLTQSTTSRMQSMVEEMMGVRGEDVLLQMVVKKILDNTNTWTHHERILKASLCLLGCLAEGHMTSRKLGRLPSITHLLNNHRLHILRCKGNNIGFLESSDKKVIKLRTKFYSSLASLLLVQSDDDATYNSFFLPLDERVERLQALQDANEDAALEVHLWCLVRDLRGVVQAFNNKKKFALLYPYIFPCHISTMTEVLHHLNYPPHTSQQLFKLITILSGHNSTMESYKGILIFKHVSFLLSRFEEHTSAMAGQSAYVELRWSWDMSKVILRSCHTHCGVLNLYRDVSLHRLLSSSVRLLLSVSIKQLVDYPKSGRSYVALIDALTEHHSDYLGGLDNDLLQPLISNLQAILQSSTQLTPPCCTALDNLCTYFYQSAFTTPLLLKLHRYPQEHPIHLHVSTTSSTLPSPSLLHILEWLMTFVIFEECKSLWCLSRPLLLLILLFPQNFSSLTARISHTYNCQQLFQDLMKGIEDNISNKNRDRFTCNLSTFKQQMQQVLTSQPHKPLPSLI